MVLSKWARLMQFVTLILCIAFFTGCDGKDKKSWEEEVELSNGTIIWVKREASFETSPGDMSGVGGGYLGNLENTLIVPANPVAAAPPVWTFKDAAPLLLDYDEEKQTWYVVATFYVCGIWERWGRPMPPYRQYEVQNGEWFVVPLDERLIGRKANLITGIVRNQSRRVTIEDRIKLEWNAGAKYKSIITTWDRC